MTVSSQAQYALPVLRTMGLVALADYLTETFPDPWVVPEAHIDRNP